MIPLLYQLSYAAPKLEEKYKRSLDLSSCNLHFRPLPDCRLCYPHIGPEQPKSR
jgi:hypothetical protein